MSYWEFRAAKAGYIKAHRDPDRGRKISSAEFDELQEKYSHLDR